YGHTSRSGQIRSSGRRDSDVDERTRCVAAAIRLSDRRSVQPPCGLPRSAAGCMGARARQQAAIRTIGTGDNNGSGNQNPIHLRRNSS
ncbi:hypothetical protein GGF37_003203, partial [Kickxella alabastrina]